MKKISIMDAIRVMNSNDVEQWKELHNFEIVEGVVPFTHAKVHDGYYTHTMYVTTSYNNSDVSEVIYSKRVSNPIEFSNELYEWLEEDVDLQSHEVYARISAKYGKSIGSVWTSDKGNFFINNKKVKGGKLLRTLNPKISEYQISDISTQLEVKNINFESSIKVVKDVTSIYNSVHLKVGSCMTRKGFSFKLLEDLGIKIIILETKRGDIIGRCLLHEDKYIDRIYSTSSMLTEKMRKHLLRKYKPIPKKYKSKKVKVSKDTFYPYMDTVNVLRKHKGGLISLQNWESQTYILNSTNGRLDEIRV